jgi:hypothetical protein
MPLSHVVIARSSPAPAPRRHRVTWTRYSVSAAMISWNSGHRTVFRNVSGRPNHDARPAHPRIAVRAKAIAPAQGDEHVTRPRIRQTEPDFDRFLSLLRLPQSGTNALRGGTSGGLLAGRRGTGEQRLDHAELLSQEGLRRSWSFLPVVHGGSNAKTAMEHQGRKVHGACNHPRSERPTARGRFRRCGDHGRGIFLRRDRRRGPEELATFGTSGASLC